MTDTSSQLVSNIHETTPDLPPDQQMTAIASSGDPDQAASIDPADRSNDNCNSAAPEDDEPKKKCSRNGGSSAHVDGEKRQKVVEGGKTTVAEQKESDVMEVVEGAEEGEDIEEDKSDYEDIVLPACAKTAEERRATKRGKASHPYRFKGEEQALMDTFEDRYECAVHMQDGKWKALDDIWLEIENSYWSKFSVENARKSISKKAKKWGDQLVMSSMKAVRTPPPITETRT